MVDKSPLVKIISAGTLPKLLNQEHYYTLMRPDLAEALNIYLTISSEYDSDFIFDAFKEFIDIYSEELQGLAIDFAKGLMSIFLSIVQKNSNNYKAIGHIIDIGNKLVENIGKHTKELLEINTQFDVIFKYILGNQIDDYFDHAMYLINSLLSYSENNQMNNLFNYAQSISKYCIYNLQANTITNNLLKVVSEVFYKFITKYNNLVCQNQGIFLDYAEELLKKNIEKILYGLEIYFLLLKNICLNYETLEFILMSIFKNIQNNQNRKYRLYTIDILIIIFCRMPISSFKILESCLDFSVILSNIFTIKQSNNKLTNSIEKTIATSSILIIIQKLSRYAIQAQNLLEKLTKRVKSINKHPGKRVLFESHCFTIEVSESQLPDERFFAYTGYQYIQKCLSYISIINNN